MIFLKKIHNYYQRAITYALVLVLFFYVLAWWVFASSIELSVDNENPDIWEIFTLEVQLEFSSLEPVQDVTIPGIENFEVFSQMQSEQTQIIHDDVSKQSFIILQLKPTNFWTFEIGPASGSFSGTTLNSNTLSIHVGEQWASVVPSISEETISKEATISGEASIDNETDQWIRGLKKPGDNVFILLLFIFLFFAFFYTIMHMFFFSRRDTPEQEPPTPAPEPVSIVQELRELKQQIPHITKQEFYEKLNATIKKVISYTYNIPEIENKTLREITPYIQKDKDVLDLFSESYTKEFDEKTDKQSSRETIIDKYLLYLGE